MQCRCPGSSRGTVALSGFWMVDFLYCVPVFSAGEDHTVLHAAVPYAAACARPADDDR